MRLVPISGKAGHGKDTIAGMIKAFLESNGKKILIIHYGDLVKFIAEKFFLWNGIKDEYGRTLLQKVGTDCIRKQSPNYWVDFITGVLSFFPEEWDYVLIPDARFPNEINCLKAAGYDVTHIRIVRPGFSRLTEEQQKHISETALDGYPADMLVMNDGTLEDLEKKAKETATYIMDN